MKKGALTREQIIKKAAELFNANGFAGASLSRLMEQTGLKKGGIYNHFANKDEIIVEAFDYSVRQVRKSLYRTTSPLKTARERLLAILDFYREYPLNPVIPGGCPLVNTSVDADNTHPALHRRVAEEWQRLIRNLQTLLQQALEEGSVKSEINAEKVSRFIVASIQGGVVLSRSLDNPQPMIDVTDQLRRYFELELFTQKEAHGEHA